ncbi:MAG TPA: class I SAM-dependent methyltransferase [Candidatus Sulfotelmatobacter sp.]|nr:class I SAM-dependent methyltransferase [Candidatus Sulfotelmatobacter sp.]
MENPHWLAEAYAEPINRSDTGYVWRNLWCRDKVCALIEANELNAAGTFLDHAAGYGLFVRLMRDNGYDFRWFDPYCQNLFSRGFEAPAPLAGKFEAVTMFEVLEHLPDPKEEVQKMAALTSTIIFTTTLLPNPVPQPADWWYYGLEHGQHIAFYTRKSLEVMAASRGYHLTSNGTDFHVLSKMPIRLEMPAPNFWERGLARFQLRASRTHKRPSLTDSDHKLIVKQTLAGQFDRNC